MKKKNIKEQIKEYYFINPNTKMRVREIEKRLKLPLPSVIRYCKELEKEGILTTIKTGNVVFYTADKINQNYLLEKKLFNIKSLYKLGLIDFIKKELSNPVIIVFGSYSKGEDIETSDIDIYIETLSKKEIDLKKFEKLLHRKIHIFRNENLKNINPNLANNIINGIILNNYIEVFK
ncbi:MAG: nucleotidyltransferase domain-containing protein [Candidatus Woesearchaeota archaeon]